MDSRFVVSLAVFIFLSGFPFGAAQNTSSPAHQAGQKVIRIRIPTKLRIERITPGEVDVQIDKHSFELVQVTIDQRMWVGSKSELRVYPAGKSRPALSHDGYGFTSGTNFDFGTAILNARDSSFPVPNKKYIIEVMLTFFETDIQPGHLWQPEGTKKYKALLHRTLVGSIK